MNYEAGRKTDRMVAEFVIGWESIGEYHPGLQLDMIGVNNVGVQDLVPHYSTNLADAWLVIERMRELEYRYEMRGYFAGEQKHYVAFDEKNWSDANPLYKATADTLPLAICRAALLAALDALEAAQ